MAAFPAPCSWSVIVTRLRGAGCVFAEDEARLLIAGARTPADLAAMVDQRVAGLPLEHVLGWAEFCGLRIAVYPGVFVPRRRTEFLVHQAAALARQTAHPADQAPDRHRVIVVDLCCGSGAVGAALIATLDRVELHAVDIDPAAVRCARRNIAAAGGQVYQGDLYQPLPATLRGRVDVLVANAPYVPTEAIRMLAPEARLHEPRVALDGGPDGLDVLRRVIAAAPRWLAPGGHLLVETSEGQAAQTVDHVARTGLIPHMASSDDHNATVVIGTRPSAVYRGVVTRLSYQRYCAEIVTQTDLLRSAIKGADMTTPVPSCPGWNLGQLLRHLGGGHRWVETIVRTRATQPPSDVHFRDLSGFTNEDPAVLDPWLAEGAAQLADTLRAAGPQAQVWTPVPGETPVFLARRFVHETLIHRADATLALGAEFTVDQDVALDAVDEWMELGSLPNIFEYHPERRELLGPGRTLHLHATDTAPEAAAEWLMDLTGDAIVWRRAHEKAAVAVRGPLTDLLLIVYRRQPARSKGIEIFGDEQLLDYWLERVGFG